VVGPVVGIKMSRVPRLARIRMAEIARGVVFPVRSYARIQTRLQLNHLRSTALSHVRRQVAMAGASDNPC
jgi:hypothetical protein